MIQMKNKNHHKYTQKWTWPSASAVFASGVSDFPQSTAESHSALTPFWYESQPH